MGKETQKTGTPKSSMSSKKFNLAQSGLCLLQNAKSRESFTRQSVFTNSTYSRGCCGTKHFSELKKKKTHIYDSKFQICNGVFFKVDRTFAQVRSEQAAFTNNQESCLERITLFPPKYRKFNKNEELFCNYITLAYLC